MCSLANCLAFGRVVIWIAFVRLKQLPRSTARADATTMHSITPSLSTRLWPCKRSIAVARQLLSAILNRLEGNPRARLDERQERVSL